MLLPRSAIIEFPSSQAKPKAEHLLHRLVTEAAQEGFTVLFNSCFKWLLVTTSKALAPSSVALAPSSDVSMS